jgi:hypothetical protein
MKTSIDRVDSMYDFVINVRLSVKSNDVHVRACTTCDIRDEKKINAHTIPTRTKFIETRSHD